MAANHIPAQLMLVGLALVAYTVVLTASGDQYGTMVGIIAGVLEFIPMVGPLIGAIAILGAAFSPGFHHPWLLILFLGGWRLVQVYINAPGLIRRNLEVPRTMPKTTTGYTSELRSRPNAEDDKTRASTVS